MFERFSGEARHVVVSAQEEARELDHNYIGTEHLLLGLLTSDSLASASLLVLGYTHDNVRAKVEEIIGRGKASPGGHIPFTPRAKKVLELSLREALQLKHNYIGTEHILLGLLREGEGVAARVLKNLEVEPHLLEHVHRDALAELDQPEQEVLGAHIVVVEAVRFFTSERQDLLRTWSEVIHHGFIGCLRFAELARMRIGFPRQLQLGVGESSTQATRHVQIQIFPS